jgi:hypothetical protein
MPSSEIMPLYRKHKLHSGRGKNGKKGKIVRGKKQAKAILISYLCREGKASAKTCAKNRKKRSISKS